MKKKRILSLPFLILNSERTGSWTEINFQISVLIIFKKISYRVKVNVPYLLFSNMYLLFVESASRCSKLCWLGGHAEKREMKEGDPPTFFASSPRWRGGGGVVLL